MRRGVVARRAGRSDSTDDAAGPDRRVQQPDPRLAETQGPDRGDDDEDGEHPAHERLDAEDGHHEEWGRQPPERREPGQEARRRSPTVRFAHGAARVRQPDRRADLDERDRRQRHSQRSGGRDRCRAAHEQGAAEAGADKETDSFARAGGDVGSDELSRRSGEPRDDGVLERTDRRRSHGVDGRDDQDDGDGRSEGEGDRGRDASRQSGHVDAQGARGSVNAGRPGSRRAVPRSAWAAYERRREIPTPTAPPSLVGVHEESNDEGPLGGDGQGPCDLEPAEVGVQQDPVEGVQRGRELLADLMHGSLVQVGPWSLGVLQVEASRFVGTRRRSSRRRGVSRPACRRRSC